MKLKKQTRINKLGLAARIVAILVTASLSYLGYSYLTDQSAIQDQKINTITSDILKQSAISAKEAKKKEPVYITLPGAKPIRALVEDYTSQSSIWTIVNKTSSVSVDYVPANLKIPNVSTRTDKSVSERSVRADIETPLINMFNDAAKYGYQLMIGSGYRSAALQSVYFNSLANSVGEELANQSIARPGQSEHQTGLAVDISTVSRQCYLDNCFADTSDGQWLTQNSYKYGFILRYPEGKESITQYQYESWHFRYVGIDLATALHESGLTLDEAWPYLVSADATLRQNGAI